VGTVAVEEAMTVELEADGGVEITTYEPAPA
jgi:hypothetical protein